MDFGGLPPEVNSARMYTGPGPGSLLAAATAWQATADEVSSAAAAYGSVIADLTSGPWAGPSAWSMAAAASPYVTWLSATGAQAQQTAAQLTAAIGAYETAFAATVPPPLIAANRSLLATLVATNILGQNTAAIAATEAAYLQMWAQDAAAMYGYAGASAAASTVSPFTPAPQTTDPTRSAAPAAAQPVSSIPGVDTETLMSAGPQLISATPSALQSLAAPAAEATTTGTGGASSGLSSSMSSLSMLSMPARMAMMPMSMLMRMLMTGGAGGAAKGATAGLASAGAGVGAAAGGLATTGAAAAPAATSVTLSGFTAGAPAATAGLGRAAGIGALSVPPAWTGMGVATTAPAAALSGVTAAAAPAGGLGHAMVPPMMPVGAMAGRGGFGGVATQYDFRPTVIPRSPAAG